MKIFSQKEKFVKSDFLSYHELISGRLALKGVPEFKIADYKHFAKKIRYVFGEIKECQLFAIIASVN